MMELSNKTALVVGGSGGIGAAIALTLARQGADVAITYARSAERAQSVIEQVRQAGRKGLAIQADALERGATARAVEAAVSEFGKVDILVSAAGVFDAAPIDELDGHRFDATFDIHVRSVFEAAKAAVPHMQDGGTIVAIGSAFGQVANFPGLSIYTASKAAVAGLTRALARELGSRGITVNTVNPGPTDTEMNPADPDRNPHSVAHAKMMAIGRYGKPEEVAALVAFLASEHGRLITGQAINADGGWTA